MPRVLQALQALQAHAHMRTLNTTCRHIPTYTCTRAYAYVRVYMYTHTHMHTYTRTRICARSRTVHRTTCSAFLDVRSLVGTDGINISLGIDVSMRCLRPKTRVCLVGLRNRAPFSSLMVVPFAVHDVAGLASSQPFSKSWYHPCCQIRSEG